MSARPVVTLRNLSSGYGKRPVLAGIDLTVAPGEMLGLIGPNGSGKSTLVKVIAGVLPPWDGELQVLGERQPALLLGKTAGIQYLPQNRRVFPGMTVRENVLVGAHSLSRRQFEERLTAVLELFPDLSADLDRQASELSGGQQQMVAVARALITRPALLLLDEPSTGLAPGLVEGLMERLQRIQERSDLTVLIVEQKVRHLLRHADRVYALRLGRVVDEAPAHLLATDTERLRRIFV
ncbi:MAG TPA: ABC transporter ATP-binding protein [Acidobacteria bacterium]|nr:ABC transporter ATP-binding protein [Acidobacteriota bacterium]